MIDWCVEEKEGRKGGVIELKRRVSITGTPNHHHTRSILCRKTGNGVCALARISIFFLIASPQRLFVCCGRSLEAGFSPCVPGARVFLGSIGCLRVLSGMWVDEELICVCL